MPSVFLPSAGCVNKGGREQKDGDCFSDHHRRAGGAQESDHSRVSSEVESCSASPPPCRLDSQASPPSPSLSSPFFPLLSSSFSPIMARNVHIKVGSGIRTYLRPAQATAIGYTTASLQSPLLDASEPPSLTRNHHRISFFCIYIHSLQNQTRSGRYPTVVANEPSPDRTHADGKHRSLRLGNRPRNPRMEQCDSTRPESRRRRLVDDEKRRKETLHVRVVPSTEMHKHCSRIPDGPSKPTVHRTEPARDTLHELYQADGVV